MINIAIVTSYSFRYPGGVQHQVISQAMALSQIPGVNVHIWAADTEHSYITIPVPYFSLGRGLRLSGNGSGLRISLGNSGIRRFLQAEKNYDIVHIHEPFYPQTLRLIHRLNTPIIGTFHAQFNSHFFYNHFNFLFRHAYTKLALKTAVSKSAKASIAQYFNDHEITIIPNGILPPKTDSTPYSERDNAVLFIGRNEPRKGLNTLIKAFHQLGPTYSDLKLWLIGPKTDQITGSNIVNFGVVTESRKFELLSRAKGLCVPSLGSESFGIILLEAMACGCPVIASKIEGYQNVITEHKNGTFFNPGNVNDLYKKLKWVLDNNDVTDTLIGNGYDTVQKFSWHSIAQNYLSYYYTLANKPIKALS